MALLYSQRGGGSLSWGVASGTWPFAYLEIYDDKINFWLLGMKKEIPIEDVTYFQRYGKIPFIFDSLYVEYKQLKHPVQLSSITFTAFGGVEEADMILKRICPNRDHPRPWYQNPFKGGAVFGLVIGAIILLGLITGVLQ